MVRGEVCIGSATGLSFIAVVLLIFAHVGQINPTSLPRNLGMVSMNVSTFATCLSNSTGDPYPGMYQRNASAPLGQHLGLRDTYAWGFFKHCAYNGSGDGLCANGTFGYRFTPVDVMLSDIISNSSTISQFIIPQSTFTNSSYLGGLSQGGFWLIFIGMICAALATVIGLKHSRPSFFIASIFASLAVVLVMIGAAIWTALLQGAMGINDTRATGGSCLGISLSYGTSLWLVWVAFIALILAVPPYIISCITYHPPARHHDGLKDRYGRPEPRSVRNR